MKSALTFIGFFLLAMGLFWAGQGADLIRWPAESFMVNARQWIFYGGVAAVIGLILILLARRYRDLLCAEKGLSIHNATRTTLSPKA
jgi:hypothetical protein